MDVTLCLLWEQGSHEAQYATAGLGGTAVLELALMTLKNPTILSGDSAACSVLGLHSLHQLALVSEIAGVAVQCNSVLGY